MKPKMPMLLPRYPTRQGLALLPRGELRQQLSQDTRQWLKTHQITVLPSGYAHGLGQYEQLNDVLIQAGLHCEY